MNKPALHIGHTAASAEKFQETLLAVINTNAGDSVKIAAIDAVKAQYLIQNISISSCTFDNRSYNNSEDIPEVLED